MVFFSPPFNCVQVQGRYGRNGLIEPRAHQPYIKSHVEEHCQWINELDAYLGFLS